MVASREPPGNQPLVTRVWFFWRVVPHPNGALYCYGAARMLRAHGGLRIFGACD